MRILVLIHEFPPIGGGGGRVAQDIARELVKLGHEVHVIAPHAKGLPLQSRVDGIHITRIHSFRRLFFAADMPAMLGYLFFGFFFGLWEIWRFRPNLIHVHFAVPAGVLAWTLSRITSVPYVLTSHLGDVPGGVPDKTDRWFRWVYPFTPRIWRDAAAVTAISEHTRHLALAHYPVEIKVIPNGIAIPPLLREMKLNLPRQIVFAGRFVDQKRPDLVPQILQHLRDLEWHCVMIGDGPLWKETVATISELGLGDRFTLQGWATPERVFEVLSVSDILLLPSRTEGLPVVGLQSLLAGVAIVASRVGSIDEIVEVGVNGFLHEPEDIQGFANSLRQLLTNPAMLFVAREASRRLSKKFNLAHIVGEYESIMLAVFNKS